MSNIISAVTAVSAVTNIYSLIAFILLLVTFVLLKPRLLEKPQFRLFSSVLIGLLAVSIWVIFQNQTKQGGQQQTSSPVYQPPAQITSTSGNALSQTNQIVVNHTGGQASIWVGNNKIEVSSLSSQDQPPLPKQPLNENNKELQTAETVKNAAVGKNDNGGTIFKAEVHVTADDAGAVNVTGDKEIVTLMQFCPDEWVRGCEDNIPIKREGNSFVLDKEGLANHRVAFNFIDSMEKWLLIPNVKVTCGANVTCETEKGYFTYTGAAAKK